MMLSYKESSNNDWISSGSQLNDKVDEKLQGNYGSSQHDTLTPSQANT
jgi:hypothetical protein